MANTNNWNITNAQDLSYVSDETHEKLTNSADAMEELLDSYLNQDLVNRSDQEKDEIYSEIKQEWDKLQDELRKALFYTNWTVDEYRFVRKYVMEEAELDSEQIFMAVRLKQEFFDPYGDYGRLKSGENPKAKDAEVEPFMTTIDQITSLYNFVSAMRVKGLMSKKADLFASIMSKIGSMNQVFNKYITRTQDLSNKVQQVASKMDEYSSSAIEELEQRDSDGSGKVVEMESGDSQG